MEARVRRRWKATERALAKRLRGERVPVTGRTRGWAPDIRHPLYAIEVKSRLSQLKIISTMLNQAEKAAEFYLERGEGERIPIGIYHVVGESLDNAYLFLRLKAFEDVFDPLLRSAKLVEEVREKAGL